MGYRSSDFKINPKCKEQIEAVVRCPEDNRSVVNGTVIDCSGRPVKDAVVKLFIIKEGILKASYKRKNDCLKNYVFKNYRWESTVNILLDEYNKLLNRCQ